MIRIFVSVLQGVSGGAADDGKLRGGQRRAAGPDQLRRLRHRMSRWDVKASLWLNHDSAAALDGVKRVF